MVNNVFLPGLVNTDLEQHAMPVGLGRAALTEGMHYTTDVTPAAGDENENSANAAVEKPKNPAAIRMSSSGMGRTTMALAKEFDEDGDGEIGMDELKEVLKSYAKQKENAKKWEKRALCLTFAALVYCVAMFCMAYFANEYAKETTVSTNGMLVNDKLEPVAVAVTGEVVQRKPVSAFNYNNFARRRSTAASRAKMADLQIASSCDARGCQEPGTPEELHLQDDKNRRVTLTILASGEAPDENPEDAHTLTTHVGEFVLCPDSSLRAADANSAAYVMSHDLAESTGHPELPPNRRLQEGAAAFDDEASHEYFNDPCGAAYDGEGPNGEPVVVANGPEQI